jgi:hypothetical protein
MLDFAKLLIALLLLFANCDVASAKINDRSASQYALALPIPLPTKNMTVMPTELQCKNGTLYCGGACCPNKTDKCCGPSPTSKYCAAKCDKRF